MLLPARAWCLTLLASLPCWAQPPAIESWVDREFKPSTLSRQQQIDELKWFAQAAAKLRKRGVVAVKVASEDVDTHLYESSTLAKAFTEITGIKVKHDLIGEGDVVDAGI